MSPSSSDDFLSSKNLLVLKLHSDLFPAPSPLSSSSSSLWAPPPSTPSPHRDPPTPHAPKYKDSLPSSRVLLALGGGEQRVAVSVFVLLYQQLRQYLYFCTSKSKSNEYPLAVGSGRNRGEGLHVLICVCVCVYMTPHPTPSCPHTCWQ